MTKLEKYFVFIIALPLHVDLITFIWLIKIELLYQFTYYVVKYKN